MDILKEIDINILSAVMLGFITFISYQRLDKKDKIFRSFISTAFLVLFQLLFESTSVLLAGNPNKHLIYFLYFINVLLFANGPFVSYVWFTFIYKWLHPNNNYSVGVVTRTIFLSPLILNFILSLLSPRGHYIFGFTESGVYFRGSLFVVSIVSTFLYLALSFILILMHRRNLLRNEFTALILFGVLPALGAFLQIRFYGLLLMWSSAAFSLVVVCFYLHQKMVQIDMLTGAWSRSYFEQHVENRFKQSLKSGKVGIVYLDLDNFKEINDAFGHFEGDKALKEAVKLIKSVIKENGLVARLGGDEFVIIINNIKEVSIKETILQLKSAFEKYNQSSEKAYVIEYSCGYGIFDPKKHSIDQFLNYVDHLMYKDKGNKKRNVLRK